ncbi:LUD domain-containing protein [Marinilongibacter aquaticus]|uniref:LutC/YkgG family protein n=1 Tax=Marinilongibacter aquaticus TaxID=2975157 RepID=UPI0021BDE58C|nr:LUD domain-containing protein [Marinilongibacter aquaticus]UBM57227.1 LUD domain-containing protein [Marinilongibacter aquaticus]
MSSREEILDQLKAQRKATERKPRPAFDTAYLGDPVVQFKNIIGVLHGQVIEVNGEEEIVDFVRNKFAGKRVINNTKLVGFEESNWRESDPHELEDVEFTLVETPVAVAENGAIWMQDDLMGQRVSPFICQYLGVIVRKEKIVPTLPQAYEILGSPNSGFGAFIAGPSKTADIEQSLVTGAHGPRDIFVFVI